MQRWVQMGAFSNVSDDDDEAADASAASTSGAAAAAAASASPVDASKLDEVDMSVLQTPTP